MLFQPAKFEIDVINGGTVTCITFSHFSKVTHVKYQGDLNYKGNDVLIKILFNVNVVNAKGEHERLCGCTFEELYDRLYESCEKAKIQGLYDIKKTEMQEVFYKMENIKETWYNFISRIKEICFNWVIFDIYVPMTELVRETFNYITSAFFDVSSIIRDKDIKLHGMYSNAVMILLLSDFTLDDYTVTIKFITGTKIICDIIQNKNSVTMHEYEHVKMDENVYIFIRLEYKWMLNIINENKTISKVCE
jgi:hypothetical protein